MKPLIEKYRPRVFSEVKCQDFAVLKIKNFLSEFKKGKKALVLHGTPGIGKTTLAHVVANELNLEIFELNASDLRNKNSLKEVLGPAIKQKSLFSKGKIILVDEVDGISAVDRGGLLELLTLIGESSYPVIVTANDIWKSKFSGLRRKSEMIQLSELDNRVVLDVLDILKKEDLFLDIEVVKKVAMNSHGDLRAAINDLCSAIGLGNNFVEFDERNKEQGIFDALQKVFKSKPSDEILGVYDSVKMPIDEIILWVEKNIPYEYQGRELERAFNLLSKVDVFKGRIYKQQYWRFLVYENILLSYGICASKKAVKTGFTKYSKPTRILKIWMNNQRMMKKKSIAQKYSKLVHVGTKRIMHDFPILKNFLKNNLQIQKELKLSEEELVYLKG